MKKFIDYKQEMHLPRTTLSLSGKYEFFQRICAFIKVNKQFIKSIAWLFILGVFWKDNAFSIRMVQSIFVQETFSYTILFYVQLVSFCIPAIFVKIFTSIFGSKNIIYQKFSEEEIAASRLLYGIYNVLQMQRFAYLAAFAVLISIFFFSAQTNAFAEQLKFAFDHSFFVIFLLENSKLAILTIAGFFGTVHLIAYSIF